MAEIEITRVSELDALEAVADEDLLAIVDDPSGASQTKKITREDFLGSAPIVATSGVTGDLTGNVTGDVTGNVTGDVTGNADTADNHSGTYAHDQAVATTSSPTFAAVTSGGSALKWKVLSGTTASGAGGAGVSHGLTASNIVGATISVYDGTSNYWIGSTTNTSTTEVFSTHEIRLIADSSNIYINTGSSLYSKAYKLVIFYT